MPVVGGEPAEADDYPSTVALMGPGPGGKWEPSCTGTLVAPTVVVTAAHCLQDWWGNPIPASQVRVVYGYTEPESAPTSALRAVSTAKSHPDYNPWAATDADGMGKTNDIGIVVLTAPVDNGIVTPILPASDVDSTLVAGTDVHVVGYGVNNLSTQEGGILYKAVTPYIRHIQWEMLAGSPGNPDSCNGDSGGPAFVMDGSTLFLAGVTSRAWKKTTVQCGDGGIYTIASEYLPWLESIGGEIGGAVDGGGPEAGLDADPACLSLSAACHPVTNEGCDSLKGEVCQLGSAGFSCHPAPNEAQPGAVCDQTSRFCVQGYHCGASLRCERYCCSDSDCLNGGPCTPLSAPGTLGTCGAEVEDAGVEASVDAGAAGASGAAGAGGTGGVGGTGGSGGGMAGTGGGSEADAGPDAQPSEPSDLEVEEEGCGCRTAGSPRSEAGWWVTAFGLALLGRRRSNR